MWHTSGRIKMGWIDGLMMSNLVSQCIHTPPCKCQFFTKFMWNRHLLILANRPSTTCCPVHLTQLIEGKHRLPFQRNKEESQDVKHMGRKKKATEEEWALPFICWGSFFGGFYANFGVPFSRWKHNHLVQELINASNQILPVPSFICYITEELRIKERKSILDHFKWQCLPKFI